MTIDLTQIILAVITLLGAVMMRFVIPAIIARTDERKRELLCAAIDTAVFAAQQLFATDAFKEKKEYVMNLLKEQGYKIDDEAINAAVEAEVLKMKNELKPKTALNESTVLIENQDESGNKQQAKTVKFPIRLKLRPENSETTENNA